MKLDDLWEILRYAAVIVVIVVAPIVMFAGLIVAMNLRVVADAIVVLTFIGAVIYGLVTGKLFK
jgi:hypothetical protein